MKLVMLLSWWDEPAENLQRAIRDSVAAGCTHAVCLDGAYPATPTDQPISDQAQYDAISDVCDKLRVPLVLQSCLGLPEPDKRTLLFELMYEHHNVTPDDWCFVMDADQTVEKAHDLKPWLGGLKGDVVDTLVYEHDDTRYDDTNRRRFVRQMFRCVPGLHVDQANHWTYKDAQQRIMWGMNSITTSGLAPIVMHNHSRDRHAERAEVRDGYYKNRTQNRLEEWIPEHCIDCPQPWAYQMAVGFHIQQLPDGDTQLTSDRTVYACQEHAEQYVRKNAARARYLASGNADAEKAIAETMAGTMRRNPRMFVEMPA